MKMSSEAELVIGVWEAIRDHVSHSKRGDIARDLLYAFADFGFEPTEMASIVDEDPDLRDAFDEVFPPPEDEEEEVDE